MVQFSLSGSWTMKECSWKTELPAAVPGTVYTDLMKNGKMQDPFYRDNEKEALEVISKDYEYRKIFQVPEELFEADRVLLHFDGIDTLSKVTLNGTVLGDTDNMHRIWEFSVKELLKEGENELSVILYSPTNYIEKSYEEEPIDGCVDAMRGLPRLRKAHCMFGWDWGPRIPDAGIFREVSLLGIHTARLDNVYVTQEHEEQAVTLNFQVEAEPARKLLGQYQTVKLSDETSTAELTGGILPELTYSVTIETPDKETLHYEGSPKSVRIENPKLWWPNGYGEQYLYGVKVELKMGEQVLDTWERRIGLRTMTMYREKDQYGEAFAHEVNGIRIFGMGADYIPEDNVLSRVTQDRTRRLLKDAHDAHFNVIRVWGGGYYPDDFFYDICDEYGLIVWQDFMFACCTYDLTESFEETITKEFIDNVKRIRHHASLGLWCGNNEMEMFIADNREGWCKKASQYGDYIRMYEYIIPKVLKTYDPVTFYWPASPSSGGGFDEPNSENRGDVHYWDVWHGGRPITEFRKFYFRYLSEFGFQSFPSLKTVETFTEPEDRNIFSYVMEKHQRNNSANGKMMTYMEQTFLYPNNFEILLYATQLLQAEAMRYGVEHFRRNRGRCMGSVIWQLNDCWPVASWAMIDYYGRWKAVQYYAKRFFAPLMLSVNEESTLTQDPNVNAQPYEVKKSVTPCAANETLKRHEVTIRWELRNSKAGVLRSEVYETTLEPQSATWLPKVDLPEADLYDSYVSFSMEENGTVVSAGTVLFCAPKFFHFHNPNLTVSVEGDEIVVSADCYAKSVQILNEEDNLLLEDNFFDLNGGSRRIKILEGKPEGLTVRSVYDIR